MSAPSERRLRARQDLRADPTCRLAVHHDTDDANANTRFFIQHALHDRADFIFILNGESELRDEFPEHLPNVRVIQRDNTCYDLGAHGEVLQADDRELVKAYDKFILMNGKSGPPCPAHRTPHRSVASRKLTSACVWR